MVAVLPPRWRRAVLGLSAALIALSLLTRLAPLSDFLQELILNGAWIPPSALVGRGWMLLGVGILTTAWSGSAAPARAVGLALFVIALDRILDLLGYPSAGLVQWLERTLHAAPASPTTFASPLVALSLVFISAALILRPLPRPGSRRDLFAGAVLLAVIFVLIPTLVSRAYGPAWSYGGLVGTMSVTMLVGMLIAAATAMALGGPAGFPLRALVGTASRSVLLRTFIPLALADLLLLAFVQRILLPRLNVPPAPAQALLSIFTLIIAVVISIIAAHLVGSEVDRSDAAHREAVARLDAERRRLGAIMDAVPVGVVVADADGRLTLANREAERIIGPGPHDSMPADWTARYGIFLPDGLTPSPMDAIPLVRALRGESVGLSEAVIRRPGTTIDVPVQASASPIPSFEDRPQGAVMVFSDLTSRKDLEVRARAAERLEAVGQLAGGVAHDFNNLLTVILGHAELLLDRMTPDDPHRRPVASMEESARRAAILTRRLLAFGRKQFLQPRTVDLRVLMAELSGPLRDAAAPDLTVEILPSPDALYLRIDPERLSESLVSLVMNARDAATRPGLVQIAMEIGEWVESRRVGADLLPPGQYARLAIRDDGPGMTPETLARALEPFFTTKPKHLGSGLGLSTVYGFIRQSGGGLTLESVLKWGTTVTLWLPLVEPPRLQVDAQASATAPASVRRTMLLAEDEPEIREMTAAFLESAGWTVLRAMDGRDALMVAAGYQGELSLLVTDIMMPHLGGIELARKLREHRPGLRVLFVSGFTDVSPEGNDPFLPKPFSPAELLAAVNLAAG